MKREFAWESGFTIPIQIEEDDSCWSQRRLSQMKTMYEDRNAAEEILKQQDPVIYEFQELSAPCHAGDLAFGAGKLYPGTVGNEYYMTKGHFHEVLETAEVYLGLKGEGLLMIESPDGSDWRVLELTPGRAVYVPKGYAHRTVNTGTIPLEYFFAFRADAGHDYGTIEEKGFRNLVISAEEGWRIIPNSKWRES